MSEPRAADTAEHAEHEDSADHADTDGTEVLHVVGHNDELVRLEIQKREARISMKTLLGTPCDWI